MAERSAVVEESPEEDELRERYATLYTVCLSVAVVGCQWALRKAGLAWDDFFLRLLAFVPAVAIGWVVSKSIVAVLEHLAERGEATPEELEQRLREFKQPPEGW